MIVISDTTPLRYLAVIGGLEWLPAIFGEVVCPAEVITECRHQSAPPALRVFAAFPPAWLRIDTVRTDTPELPDGVGLDAGETAALRLARQLGADLVLMDERRGRAVAAGLGLEVTGTLGILVEASLRGIADFEEALAALISRSNIRVSDAVIAAARNRLKRHF